MKTMIIRKKTLRLAAGLLLLCLLATGIMLLQPNHLISQVSSQTRLLPIYEVATCDDQVAISFDASWGAEYTPDLLNILDEYQVKATFFLVNIWLEEYPQLAREIALRGHEIGMHSTTHPHFSQLSDGEILQELKDNYELIQQTTGYTPKLFRPPFGDYNNKVVELVNACGYDCIQWSVDSLDWKDLEADEICQRVTKDIQAGDIVLFHNNGLHTAEALPQILDCFREKGLEAVPVCELLLEGDCYIDYNGVQRSK